MIYTTKQFQVLMDVGENKARAIMRRYGFRTGYTPRSHLRISDEGVKKWMEYSHEVDAAETPEDSFHVGKEIR